MAPSVDHWELQGYPIRVTTQDGMKGIRKVVMAGSDVGEFMDQMWDSGNNRWPTEYDSNWAAYLWEMRSDPMKDSQSSPQNTHYLDYALEVVTLKYTTTAMALNTTGVVSETFSGADHWMTLGHRSLVWNSGQAGDPTFLTPDEQSTVQVCIPKARYIREERGITSIPAGCLAYIGNTNNTIVLADVLGLSFAVDELMYKNPQISRSLTIQGNTRFRIIHTAEFNPQGWNKFLRKATGQFEHVYNEDLDQFEYPSANLNLCYSK